MFLPPTEAQTRKELIDEQLAKAGWDLGKPGVVEELRLSDSALSVHDLHGMYKTSSESVDYALMSTDGKPLAIVEAKRTSRDALAGQRQASDYNDRIREIYGIEPFIFLANGREIWLWDKGRYPLRKISGFYSRDDLDRLLFQRKYRLPLEQVSHNTNIIDRPYQLEAIRSVTEKMTAGNRKFLMVMATGTGKTRTTIALIDLLMRARWIQRVLFLADRRELVQQALGDLKEYMPNETRARIEQGEVDDTARIHVSTYPSMMSVYQELSPGYYDLIIADESHRSIYNRYKAIFDHFDAIHLGLTATPTDYIDHNTFQLFECEDGLPTFNYGYDTAVQEGYLVNYKVHYARTTFQIEGIKAGQIPPEMERQLQEQGIDLSEIDFEGTDLERRVTNTGTTDAIVREIMDNCRRDSSDTLPAKTILFGMSHKHAVEIWMSFNRLYPSLQTQGFAQIIDSHMERSDKLVDDFKRKDMPRLAISVDMLDTGIDVPAIQNLVFAKPVFSQVKFWQMIGRGTRLWHDPQTGKRKESFLIFDFWNNFTYFNMNPEGEIASPTEPLPVRLFRLRLEKLLLQQGLHADADGIVTRQQLISMLTQLPTDNVNIRPHAEEITRLMNIDSWYEVDEQKITQLRQTIAPLTRFLPEVVLTMMTFEVRTERLATAFLTGDSAEIERVREQIINDLQHLPVNLPVVTVQLERLAWVKSDGFWDHLTTTRIMDLQTTFAPLMRYRQREEQQLIHLHLPDQIATRWIIYGPSGEGAFAENYRHQVEAFIHDLTEQHPSLRKLRNKEPLTEADIQALARTLNQADLFITVESLRQAYHQPDADLEDFLRYMLGLSELPSQEEQISTAFDAFIADHPYFSARQITFLRVVRSQVLRRAHLSNEDFARPPFNRVGKVEAMFSPKELDEIIDFANQFAENY
jgi:type I restriction enzyme R subunit